MTRIHRALILMLAGMAAACGGEPAEEIPAADGAPAAAPAEGNAALETIRAATSKYEDVNVALAEGFIPDPSGMCVIAAEVGAPPEAGAMGIHYFRPDLLGVGMPPAAGRLNGTDGAIDPSQPEVLVYEPQTDGSMVLGAVEYLVFEQPWLAGGNSVAPSVAGGSFFLMADDPATEIDEAHGFEPHYELHVWLYRENPAGVFAEFNPAVTCEHAPPPAPPAM